MYYSFRCDCGYDATLAQSVERFTRNEKVAGSIPAGSLHQKSPQNLDMLPSYRTMKYKSPIWGYFHVQKE